ncbi:MAG TPA: hypothetical protein VJK54_11675 [Chthoniobacterales bacterium]|nr:hypothetical protein [Chthoniobacterales bacterium]
MKYIPIFFIVVLANANLLAQVVIGLNMTKQISENWPYSTSQQDQTDVNYQPRVTNCNNSNSDLNCYLMMDPSKIQQSSKLGRDLTQMFDQGILNNRKPVIEKPPVGMTSVFNKFSNSSNVLNSATATMEAISDSFSSQVFGSEKLEGEDLKSTKKINEGLDSITSEYVRQVLEAYPCAGRLIIVEEGGVISIQARDAVQNASERNKSENKKIIDKLRELFPELAADSLLRYQVSSNNSKISMGVDSLTSSRLREILAKVDERGLARVQGGAVASSPEDSDYEDVDDESDFLSTQIQYNIETTGKAKVATRLLKKKIQAKKNLKNIIQQCNLGSNFDTMSVFSRRSKGSVVSVSSVVLERMIEEIAALKTAASQIMSEKPNTETVRLQLEAAETAWRDAEMEARHAATFSNTAETEKAFKEAVRLSQKVERAWDKAFNAKNTLLAKTSEADQPVLHDKIEEAEMQKRYWAAKILWNEAGQEECRATASLQQVIKPNNPGEVNLWYNRVIEIASNAETAWDKAATAFRGGAHLIPERLEDLKEQWMIDLEKADKSKNDWAQKVNEVKQEEIARKEAEQKEMERERKQAEEQAALENQKKKMEAIKKAEEERIAKAEKARIESERQAERQKAAEEKAKREREQADVEVRERAGREARNRMPINICKEKARKAQEKWTQLQSISQHHHYYYCADAYKQAASAYYTTYKMWRDAAETTSIISLPDYLQQAQRFEQEALNHLRAGNAQVSARYPTAFLPMLPENL